MLRYHHKQGLWSVVSSSYNRGGKYSGYDIAKFLYHLTLDLPIPALNLGIDIPKSEAVCNVAAAEGITAYHKSKSWVKALQSYHRDIK